MTLRKVVCTGVIAAVLPVVPVLCLIDVKLRYIHVFSLPGGLIIRQITPLDQIVDIVLPVNTLA